jgi:hypothetical protein
MADAAVMMADMGRALALPGLDYEQRSRLANRLRKLADAMPKAAELRRKILAEMGEQQHGQAARQPTAVYD